MTKWNVFICTIDYIKVYWCNSGLLDNLVYWHNNGSKVKILFNGTTEWNDQFYVKNYLFTGTTLKILKSIGINLSIG